MPNINKVVYGNTTLIDLTNSTLSSADQLAQGVTAYDRSGTLLTGTASGGTAAISIVDTPDSHGGDVRTITALDISDTTATASDVLSSKYFYTADGTKTQGSISTGSVTVDEVVIEADPTISVNSSTGVITASYSDTGTATASVTPGYVSSATSGTYYISGSSTHQLSTQAAATITPTTSQQTAVAAGKYTTGAVTVSAMPSGTAGTPTATKGTVSNHSVSVTPSVTNTTGYITGSTKTGTAVTVSASELVSGSETKAANGTYDVTNLSSLVVAVPFSTIYSGSSAPTSSQGANGDIYIQTS